MSIAALGQMAQQLAPLMRNLGDVQAVGSMVGKAAHMIPMPHAGLGIGKDSGPGLNPMGIGASALSMGAKAGWNMTGGAVMRQGVDAAKFGLTFAANREQQQVGNEALDFGERMVGKGMNVLTNPLNPKNVIEFGAELVAIIPTIEKWGKMLLGNVDSMAKFDVSMAKASAMLQMGEVKRNVATAQVTGDSALAVAEGLEHLMDELRPIRDSITVLLNDSMVSLIEIGRSVLEFLVERSDELFDFFRSLLEWLGSTFGGILGHAAALKVNAAATAEYTKILVKLQEAEKNKGADKASMDLIMQARSRIASPAPVAESVPVRTFGGSLQGRRAGG